MSDLSAVCAYCKTDINTVFVTGPRTTVTISGQQIVTDPCFVADEIIFTNQGQLIFQVRPPVRDQGKGFPVDCVVVCRKLTVQGGGQPINLNPCDPGDPGTRYNNTNLITYFDRLVPIPPADPISPPSAAAGATPGADGNPGMQGNSGTDVGHGVTGALTVVALEVDVAAGGNLVIDWAGQDGGDGGPGQNGGNGAKGTTGNDGSDASWPSSGCDTATGNGGTGGDGGPGGLGGPGGKGGNANQIIVISTPANLSGVFSNPGKITFVTQSVGGKGGKGGHGGGAGAGGNPGHPTGSCGAGAKGDPGNSLIGVTASAGGPGSPGTSLSPKKEVIDASGSCSSLLPLPLQLPAASALPLQTFIRCFSGSASGNLSVIGQDLNQVASVSTSLAGVTASIKNSSTDTELDLSISIAANSALGTGDLIFAYAFPPAKTQTLSGAIVVETCTATSISPTSGAHGAPPFTVTLTGTGFDPTASNHNISVSGLGVNVINVAVVDDQHMTCTFEVDTAASKTTRDVTVTAGSGLGGCSYTLVQSFTVT